MSGPRHLVLIGLMGAGKTSVGRQCAVALARGFVDTDDLICATSGMTVSDIFDLEGEAGFRSRERAAVAEVVASPEPLVIACGGGAVVDPDNRRALANVGFVVWLSADPNELAARVTADGVATRPLLGAGPTVATLSRLADARQDAYAAAADVIVATDGLDLVAVTDAVLAAFGSADPQ
ncbi:MAG: shikimate kinase [Acidimicrobiia bacterium]